MAELKQFTLQNAVRGLAVPGLHSQPTDVSRAACQKQLPLSWFSLCCVWDGPTPRTVNALRIWPQKDIVSHKQFEFPVLKNSRPRKRLIYGWIFSKLPWSSYTDFSKKTHNMALIQLCTWLEKQWTWWGKFREATSDLVAHLYFSSLWLRKTRGHLISSFSPHAFSFCPHTDVFLTNWILLQCIFFQVEVLKQAEPKLGHILGIYFEIAHITFCKFKDLTKTIWLVLSPDLVSFSTVCRRGQRVRGFFVCVISCSAEQLHMVCCISQLAKYFIVFELLLDWHEVPERFPSYRQRQSK